MGTVVRISLIIIAVTLWLMFSLADCNPGLSNRRRANSHYTINRWFSSPSLSATPYEECSDTKTVGRATRVEVVGCDSDPCILQGGSNATVKIDFIPSVDVKKVNAIVHGIVGFVPVPFHLPQSDACTNSGLTCPLSMNQAYSYFASIPVLKQYPRVSVKVKWELKTGAGADLVCIIIPAKIA